MRNKEQPAKEKKLERHWYAVHTYSGYEDAVARYLKQRVDLAIRARAIAPDMEKWRKRALCSKKELRDVRFISSGAEYSPEINIFDDRVLMISWKENFAVLIFSKDFAHAQRVIYDELWNKLSE